MKHSSLQHRNRIDIRSSAHGAAAARAQQHTAELLAKSSRQIAQRRMIEAAFGGAVKLGETPTYGSMQNAGRSSVQGTQVASGTPVIQGVWAKGYDTATWVNTDTHEIFNWTTWEYTNEHGEKRVLNEEEFEEMEIKIRNGSQESVQPARVTDFKISSTSFQDGKIVNTLDWDSSTDDYRDLIAVEMREVVYYLEKDPVFLWDPPNPTSLPLSAAQSIGKDSHEYPPGLKDGISNPRQAGIMLARQQYQVKYPGGEWERIPGQDYEIKREVFQDENTLKWMYGITKKGYINTDYIVFTTVEIPPVDV